jgi:hypothetical protein
MPTTGTAPALTKAPVSVNARQGSENPQLGISISVRQGARCFFWIGGLVILNSVFEILGSKVHRFTGLGVAEIMGGLTQFSEISILQAIVSFWLAGGLLLIGHLAAGGRKQAFAVGMAAYAVDGALMVAAGDYLGAIFHGLMLYGIYRGFAALGQSLSAKPSGVASAANAR